MGVKINNFPSEPLAMVSEKEYPGPWRPTVVISIQYRSNFKRILRAESNCYIFLLSQDITKFQK